MGASDAGREKASQAEVNYSAAQQNLILRVANAYFGVLRAQDNLTVILAEKSRIPPARADQTAFRRGFGGDH
ncbi:TolC family protein [Plesiomonas shigelloides]|nr:TolC family protein [Plesiomonas shigelloides]